jgi:hypothetical protein
MTMAAHTNLNRVAVEAKPDNLAQSLVQLHRLTKETLGQRRDGSESDDGLDIGLCAYERSSDILTYAGARIDLLAVGAEGERVVPGYRVSLGYAGVPDSLVLSHTSVPAASRQSFVLSTDGFPSQLGGPDEFPFGKARFQEWAVRTADREGAARKQSLEEVLKEYRGPLEQIDDITVWGFRIAKKP